MKVLSEIEVAIRLATTRSVDVSGRKQAAAVLETNTGKICLLENTENTPSAGAARMYLKASEAVKLDRLAGAPFILEAMARLEGFELTRAESGIAAEGMKRYRKNKKSNPDTESYDRNDRNAPVTELRPEAEAKTEADSEQSRAGAGAPVDEDLKRKASALGAGISAHFLSRKQPIPNLDRCLLWLTQGYAAGTILAAVETVLKRGKPISTLDYFDGAIKDHHAKLPSATDLQVVSSQVFVIVGTQAHACWDRYSREHERRESNPACAGDG